MSMFRQGISENFVYVQLHSLQLFSLASEHFIKVSYKATDSIPKGGNATWLLATLSLKVLITP